MRAQQCLTLMVLAALALAVVGLPWELGGSDTSPGRFANVPLDRPTKAKRSEDGHDRSQPGKGSDKKAADNAKGGKKSSSTFVDQSDNSYDRQKAAASDSDDRKADDSSYSRRVDERIGKKASETEYERVAQLGRIYDSDNDRRKAEDTKDKKPLVDDENKEQKRRSDDRSSAKQSDSAEDRKPYEDPHGRKDSYIRSENGKPVSVNDKKQHQSRNRKVEVNDDSGQYDTKQSSDAAGDGSYEKAVKSEDSYRNQRKQVDEYDRQGSGKAVSAKKAADQTYDSGRFDDDYSKKPADASSSYGSKEQLLDSSRSARREVGSSHSKLQAARSDRKSSAAADRSPDEKKTKVFASEMEEKAAGKRGEHSVGSSSSSSRSHVRRRHEKLRDRATAPPHLDSSWYQDLLADNDSDYDDLLLDELLLGKDEEEERLRRGSHRGQEREAHGFKQERKMARQRQ